MFEKKVPLFESAVVRILPANAGHTRASGLIPGLGRLLGEGSSSPVQYSCLENFMNRGAWWAMSMGLLQRPGYDCTTEHTHTHTRLITSPGKKQVSIISRTVSGETEEIDAADEFAMSC